MQARGDRDHDIAAWFGVNQGRVAEAKDGKFGTLEAASKNELPPRGPPGIKGRRLRASIDQALTALAKGDAASAGALLAKAKDRYDSDET
jgi:hypothetical protein